MSSIIEIGRAFTRTREQIILQVTGNTPVIAHSYPIIENKVVSTEGYIVVYNSSMTNGAVAKIETAFVRRAGNIIRVANPNISLIISSFSAPQPSLDLIANVSTQSIDVTVTGKAGEALRWHLDLLFRETI